MKQKGKYGNEWKRKQAYHCRLVRYEQRCKRSRAPKEWTYRRSAGVVGIRGGRAKDICRGQAAIVARMIAVNGSVEVKATGAASWAANQDVVAAGEGEPTVGTDVLGSRVVGVHARRDRSVYLGCRNASRAGDRADLAGVSAERLRDRVRSDVSCEMATRSCNCFVFALAARPHWPAGVDGRRTTSCPLAHTHRGLEGGEAAQISCWGWMQRLIL